jgi:hypothetical protein
MTQIMTLDELEAMPDTEVQDLVDVAIVGFPRTDYAQALDLYCVAVDPEEFDSRWMGDLDLYRAVRSKGLALSITMEEADALHEEVVMEIDGIGLQDFPREPYAVAYDNWRGQPGVGSLVMTPSGQMTDFGLYAMVRINEIPLAPAPTPTP